MSDDRVDFEWAWPPIQAESNKAVFAYHRLLGKTEYQAYEAVLLRIVRWYCREVLGVESFATGVIETVTFTPLTHTDTKPELQTWLSLYTTAKYRDGKWRDVDVHIGYDMATGWLCGLGSNAYVLVRQPPK